VAKFYGIQLVKQLDIQLCL